MKMKKSTSTVRLLSLLMTIGMILSCVSPAFAASPYTFDSPDTGSISPTYLEVCNGKAYHEMAAHWHGSVLVNGSTYISFGCAWQCTGCYMVMVTEGEMLLPGYTVGKWAQTLYEAPLGPFEAVVIVDPIHYGVCNSTEMDGYKFVLAT